MTIFFCSTEQPETRSGCGNKRITFLLHKMARPLEGYFSKTCITKIVIQLLYIKCKIEKVLKSEKKDNILLKEQESFWILENYTNYIELQFSGVG